MPTHTEQHVFPHNPERMFDLVADVERYPEFLPLWQEAAVTSRKGNVYYTDQVVLMGLMRQRFRSKTVLQRLARIDVISVKGPFRRFTIRWDFKPMPNESCSVDCSLVCEADSFFLEGIIGAVLASVARDIVMAFDKRADEVYGNDVQSDSAECPLTDGILCERDAAA